MNKSIIFANANDARCVKDFLFLRAIPYYVNRGTDECELWVSESDSGLLADLVSAFGFDVSCSSCHPLPCYNSFEDNLYNALFKLP